MAKRAAKTAKAAATSRRKEGQRSAKSAEASAPTLDKAPTARQPKPKPAAAKPVTAKPAKAKPPVAAKSSAKSARSAAAAPAAKAPKKPAASVAVSKDSRAKAAPAEPKTKAAKAAAQKPAKSVTTRPAKPDAKAAKAPTSSKAAAAKPTSRKAKAPAKPRYLAAELGQPLDPRGEPIGASSSRAASDEDLQKYALQLWRQMQSGRVVNRYTRAIERAGLTVDEVWTAGLADMRTTSSTADEIRRYRQKILFRANLLEAIFAETIADLRRLDGIEPGDAPKRESA